MTNNLYLNTSKRLQPKPDFRQKKDLTEDCLANQATCANF